MAQVTITNYFSKRKRRDDIKTSSKVLVLERSVSHSCTTGETGFLAQTYIHKNAVKVASGTISSVHTSKQIIQSSNVSGGKKKVRFDDSRNVGKNVFSKSSSCKYKASNCDIRKSFQKVTSKVCDKSNRGTGICVRESGDESEGLANHDSAFDKEVPHATSVVSENACLLTEPNSDSDSCAAGSNEVAVQVESGIVTPTLKISPKAVFAEVPHPTSVVSEMKSLSTEPTLDSEACGVSSSEVQMQAAPGLMSPIKQSPKELSLSEIKSRLSRSEKLKQAISRFSKASARCAQLEAAREELNKTGPTLGSFEKVEVEIPVSPQKTIQRSPKKQAISSPHKTTSLPLPFSYRELAEVFRCVDVVVSMLHNRSEVVTFKKVKAAVQEMLHRTLTEQHLGQIKTVFPGAYIFHQEKLRNFGSTSKADTYELTITPVLCTSGKIANGLATSNEETLKTTDKPQMTPTCLLERKRTFYNHLLERVFIEHEKFLSSLDPPLLIPRGELARWHPQFEVDTVEEVAPQELPQPPNVKKFTSAKDVLDKAKDLFSCNQRMQSVLQRMSGDVSQSGCQSSMSSEKDISLPIQDSVQSALKGIPKSLLEKVRARQAARARLAMTRPVEDKECVEHSRLPELARILRNMFVTERKVALPLELAVLKLQNSYREKLAAREFEQHIKLLVDLVPGWIAIYSIRNTDYLKLSRNGDINKVIQKLEDTALEKKNSTQILNL